MLQQKVIMIAHQHTGVDLPTGLAASFAQSPWKQAAILIVGKDVAALIAEMERSIADADAFIQEMQAGSV